MADINYNSYFSAAEYFCPHNAENEGGTGVVAHGQHFFALTFAAASVGVQLGNNAGSDWVTAEISQYYCR